MKPLSLFVTAALVVLPSYASAAKPPPHAQSQSAKAPERVAPAFEFRGHHIGESAQDHFPYFDKGFVSGDQPYCTQKSELKAHVYCADLTVYVPNQRYLRLADVPINDLNYGFLDGRLYTVEMGFPAESFFALRTMLTGKYGPPGHDETAVVQNRLGAKFDSHTATWAFAEGTLFLREHSVDLRAGTLWFLNPRAEAEIKATREAPKLKAGKEAF